MRALALPALSLTLLLTGCDLFGESAESVAARREAEGKAVGSACRHATRAIEDCYALNPKAPKASVFAGWREMDEYMRENKIDGVAPTIPSKPVASGEAKAGPEGKEGKPESKPEGKGKSAKAGAKKHGEDGAEKSE
jgi:hypothetical protein